MSYSSIATFGSFGIADGQFKAPNRIAVNNNFIYVCDRDNNRVQIFNKTAPFTFVGKFGGPGTGNGQFGPATGTGPSGIDVDDNFIYVADTANNRIQVFNIGPPYAFAGKFGTFGNGNGQFNNPQSASVDITYIYICDFNNNRMQRLLKTAPYTFQNSFGIFGSGDGQLNGPIACKTIGIGAGNIYVCDQNNQRISIWRGSDIGVNINPYEGTFGNGGNGNGQFNNPQGIKVNADFIYVCDRGNNQIQIFDRTRPYAFVEKFGSLGAAANQFDAPRDIAIDQTRIYVCELNNNRVQIFERDKPVVKSITGAASITSPTILKPPEIKKNKMSITRHKKGILWKY